MVNMNMFPTYMPILEVWSMFRHTNGSILTDFMVINYGSPMDLIGSWIWRLIDGLISVDDK